jgi:hypothetical protein
MLNEYTVMEKILKIAVFVFFVGYMIVSLIIHIPEKINNVLYGILAIFSLFFIFTNKESFGINDIFKNTKDKD